MTLQQRQQPHEDSMLRPHEFQRRRGATAAPQNGPEKPKHIDDFGHSCHADVSKNLAWSVLHSDLGVS